MHTCVIAALALGVTFAATDKGNATRRLSRADVEAFDDMCLSDRSHTNSAHGQLSIHSIVSADDSIVLPRQGGSPRDASKRYAGETLEDKEYTEDKRSTPPPGNHINIFNLQVDTLLKSPDESLSNDGDDSPHSFTDEDVALAETELGEVPAEHNDLLNVTRLESSSKSIPSEKTARADPRALVRRSFFRGHPTMLGPLIENDNVQRTLMIEEAIRFVSAPPPDNVRLPLAVFSSSVPLPDAESSLRSVLSHANFSFHAGTIPEEMRSGTLSPKDVSIHGTPLTGMNSMASLSSMEGLPVVISDGEDALRERITSAYNTWMLAPVAPPFAAFLVAEVARTMAITSLIDPAAYLAPSQTSVLHMRLSPTEANIFAAALALVPLSLRSKADVHAIILAIVLSFRMYSLVDGGLQKGAVAGVISAALRISPETARKLAAIADALGVSDAVELAHMALLWRAWPAHRSDPVSRVDAKKVYARLDASRGDTPFALDDYDTPVFGASETTTFGEVWQHTMAKTLAAAEENWAAGRWPRDSLLAQMYNCVEEAMQQPRAHRAPKIHETPAKLLARIRDALAARRMLQSYAVLCAEVGRNPDRYEQFLATPKARTDITVPLTPSGRSPMHMPTYDSAFLGNSELALAIRGGASRPVLPSGVLSTHASAIWSATGSPTNAHASPNATTPYRLERDAVDSEQSAHMSLESVTSEMSVPFIARINSHASESEKSNNGNHPSQTRGHANPALPAQKVMFLERIYSPTFDVQMQMAATLGIWAQMDALLLAHSGALSRGAWGADSEACRILAAQINKAALKASPLIMAHTAVTLNDVLSVQEDPLWASRVARFGALGLWDYILALEDWRRVQAYATRYRSECQARGKTLAHPSVQCKDDYDAYTLSLALTDNDPQAAFPAFAGVTEFIHAARKNLWTNSIDLRQVLLHVNGVALPGEDVRRMATERDVSRAISWVESERGSSKFSMSSAFHLTLALRYVLAHWATFNNADAPRDLPFRALRSLGIPQEHIEIAKEATIALDMPTHLRAVAVAVVHVVLQHKSGALCPQPGLAGPWRESFVSFLSSRAPKEEGNLAAFLVAKDGPTECVSLTTLLELQNALMLNAFGTHNSLFARLFGPIAAASLNSRLLNDNEDSPSSNSNYNRDQSATCKHHKEGTHRHPLLARRVDRTTLAMHLNALGYPAHILQTIIACRDVETIDNFITVMERLVTTGSYEQDLSEGSALTYDSMRSFREAFASRTNSTLGRSFARLSRLYSTIASTRGRENSAEDPDSPEEVIYRPPMIKQGAHNAKMLSPFVAKFGASQRFDRDETSPVGPVALPGGNESYTWNPHNAAPDNPPSMHTIGRSNSKLAAAPSHPHHLKLLRAGTMHRSSLHVLRETDSERRTSGKAGAEADRNATEEHHDDAQRPLRGGGSIKPSNFKPSEGKCNCIIC